MITLRPYQEEVKAAVYQHLRTHDTNPVAVVPTAGGKTPIMASICKDAVTIWAGRVLILAHVKELLEQTAEKLTAVCPEIEFGIYSAGLKRRDKRQSVIVASIQSIYKKACDFEPFDLILVDEAHLIAPEGDGMYRQFLSDAKVINPHLRIVGFTATPYRLKSGMICTPDGFLNEICHEVSIRELIRDGFLCPLISKACKSHVDTSHVHIQGGEFVANEVETLVGAKSVVEAACAEIVERAADRNACLIFAVSIAHAKSVIETLAEKHGIQCALVTGNTPATERATTLRDFKEGRVKYLCNVNVLTTGFDAPNIDCVALLRPTMSPGLYYQMVGRGFRIHESKKNCLILDFGGNVERHGPVDAITIRSKDGQGGVPPTKVCGNCQRVVPLNCQRCPDCGELFPVHAKDAHDPEATDAGILKGQVTTKRFKVEDTQYRLHVKRDAEPGAPRTLRVDYYTGFRGCQSEWVCFEHDGYARHKAVAWWRKRSPDPVPETIEEALDKIGGGALAETLAITVRSVAGETFDRIVDYELGPLPQPLEAEDFDFGADETQDEHALYEWEDVPF